jgi:hypothetical protein
MSLPFENHGNDRIMPFCQFDFCGNEVEAHPAGRLNKGAGLPAGAHEG